MWWAIGAGAAYAAGALGTAVYNLSIIVGPVTYPSAIIRNALLWPWMLPRLIRANRDDWD